MPQPNDLSRSLVALDQDSTLIAVIEMGQASWLVAGIVPGVNRHPLKKIATDQEQLMHVLRRWVTRHSCSALTRSKPPALQQPGLSSRYRRTRPA